MAGLDDAGWFDVARTTAGGELIAGVGLPNPFLSTADANWPKLRSEGVQVIAQPARLLKIASQVSDPGATPVAYPADGGVLPTQSSPTPGLNQVKLHASADAQVGLVLAVLAGSAVGEWGLITAWDGGQDLATIHRNWTVQPAAGDTLALLVPCYRSSHVLVKSEFSGAAGVNAELELVFFDIGLTAALARRKPIAMGDAHRLIQALTGTHRVEETSYRHGETLRVEARGGVGFKVELHKISSGNLSLWASG